MLMYFHRAGVAKLVDAHALGACQATGGGSSPLPGTTVIGIVGSYNYCYIKSRFEVVIRP